MHLVTTKKFNLFMYDRTPRILFLSYTCWHFRLAFRAVKFLAYHGLTFYTGYCYSEF